MAPPRKSQPIDPRDSFIPGYNKIATKAAAQKFKQLDGAIWTRRKALLIQTYLRLFVRITFRGTYIDAFAGPQEEHQEATTWAARRVWEFDPGPKLRRIDKFELFEENKQSIEFIRNMLSQTPTNKRTVHVHRGDSNILLPERLLASPVKGPAFCLLDQRSDECNWNTVRAVASHKKGEMKIEVFYFVMAGWLDRYRSGIADRNRDEKFQKWWGHPEFSALEKASPERAAELFADRFKNELGYAFAYPYPIYDNISPSEKGVVKFYMIHATDHPDATELMRRSFAKLATGWDPNVSQEAMSFIDEDDLTAMLSDIPSWDRHITAEESSKRRRRRPIK